MVLHRAAPAALFAPPPARNARGLRCQRSGSASFVDGQCRHGDADRRSDGCEHCQRGRTDRRDRNSGYRRRRIAFGRWCDLSVGCRLNPGAGFPAGSALLIDGQVSSANGHIGVLDTGAGAVTIDGGSAGWTIAGELDAYGIGGAGLQVSNGATLSDLARP